MGEMGCPETSVSCYQSRLSEQRRSYYDCVTQFHQIGQTKVHTVTHSLVTEMCNNLLELLVVLNGVCEEGREGSNIWKWFVKLIKL